MPAWPPWQPARSTPGPAHAADAIAYIAEYGFQNLFSFGVYVDEYISGGSGSTVEWIDANPVLVQAIVDTQIEAARWATDNRDEFLAYSLEVIPEEELPMFAREAAYDIYMEVGLYGVNGAFTDSMLQATMDIEQATGGIESPARIPRCGPIRASCWTTSPATARGTTSRRSENNRERPWRKTWGDRVATQTRSPHVEESELGPRTRIDLCSQE